MNVKYDWVMLRRKFITGDYVTVKEFAEMEAIPYAAVRKRSAEWTEQKRTLAKRKENKIVENVLNKQIATASEINNRHIEIFNKALNAAEQGLSECMNGESLNASKFEKIVDSLQKIQKAQRLALGMDRDGGNQAVEDNVARVFAEMRRAFRDESADT